MQLDPIRMNASTVDQYYRSITLHSPDEMERAWNEMRHFLSECDLLSLSPLCFGIVNELLFNAMKANHKRIFFHNHDLDINKEYEAGNQLFRQNLKESANYDALIENKKYHVEVLFSIDHKIPSITVLNNVEMHPSEKEQVDRMLSAIESMESGFSEIHPGEGAGIGLSMSSNMLRAAGLPPETISFSSENGETRFKLQFPRIENDPDGSRYLECFEKKSRFLPITEETRSLLSGVNLEINGEALRDILIRDSTLLLNFFISTSPHTSTKGMLEKAILKKEKFSKIIDQIPILDSDPVTVTKFRTESTSSSRIAFLSDLIATKFLGRSDELYFLSGLFSRVGKMILYGTDSELLFEMIRSSGRIPPLKDRPPSEEAAFGISHARLAGYFLKHWVFPEPLIQAILHQERPLHAPEPYRTAAGVLFAANLYMKQSGSSQLFQLSYNREILERLGFTDMEKWADLHALYTGSKEFN